MVHQKSFLSGHMRKIVVVLMVFLFLSLLIPDANAGFIHANKITSEVKVKQSDGTWSIEIVVIRIEWEIHWSHDDDDDDDDDDDSSTSS